MLFSRYKILFLVCLTAGRLSLTWADVLEEELGINSSKQEERLNIISSFLDKLTPSVEVKTSINDNIFRTTEDIEGDFITTISPTIEYGDPTSKKKTNISAMAGVSFKGYSEHDEHNVANPYFDFLFSHGLGRFALVLDYEFLKDQETLTDVSTTAAEGFVDYFEHHPRLELNVDLNRFLWELAYEHQERAYREDEFKATHNYEEDTFSFAGSLKIFPKTYLFLEYDRRWKDYNKGGRVDRDHDEYWLGLKGKISSKIKGLIKFGYEEGHFPEEDKSSSAVNINLNYAVSRRLSYNLEIEQGIGTSVVGADELDSSQSLALRCAYLPPFNKRMLLRAKVSFDFEEYDSGREDKSYGLVLSSEYKLREWLKAIAEYEFKKEDSDITLAQYKNNIVSLRLNLEF